jgi:hypothetical protein
MEGHGRVKLILGSENSIPLLSLAFDGTRLDGSLHFTMKLDLEMTYFAKMESLIDDLIAPLGIGERVVAVSTLETGVTRLLTIPHPPEEGLHSFVEPLEDILLHLAMDVLIFFSHLFNSRKLVGLDVIGNRHTIHPISFTPFFKSSIVQFLAPAEYPF